MRQFDVFDLGAHGLVVNCQSDLLSHLRSRIVIPLRRPDDLPTISPRLNPLVTVEGSEFVLAAQFLRAVDRAQLNTRVTSLADQDMAIKQALDMLISGY